MTTQPERRVAGALRSCIDAHGPITRDLVPSATKRVLGALRDDVSRVPPCGGNCPPTGCWRRFCAVDHYEEDE